MTGKLIDTIISNLLIVSFGLILTLYFSLLWFWPVYYIYEDVFWIRTLELLMSVAILIYGVVRSVKFCKAFND